MLRTFPTPSTAIESTKARARWVENEVETDIRVDNYGSYFQLHKRGIEDGSVYSGRPFGLARYFIPSTAWKRLITIQPYTPMAWRSHITPTAQAVTSEPERVVVSGTRGYSVFSGTPIAKTSETIASPKPAVGSFFAPTTAPLRIYNRYAVLDPTVREIRRPPVQFMGVGRFGFPNFTAWAEVTVGNQLSRWAAGFGFYLRGSKFWIPHDGTPIRQVREAIVDSKALRDRILLDIGPRPVFVAGDLPVLADINTVIVGRPANTRQESL